MADDDLDIPLAEAVRAVRHEVLEAVREAQDDDLRFALGDIELEFQVLIARQAGAQTGFTLWVLSAGGSASRTRTETHVVRLKLKPVSASGDTEILVASEEAERPD